MYYKAKEIQKPTEAERKRFHKLVSPAEDGCHNWTGTISNGYGSFRARNKMYRAHRIAVALTGRIVTTDKEVDHICKNRRCVNPEHLRLVYKKENWEASNCPSRVNRDKTHCKRGHLFNKENTKLTKSGQRKCRKCQRQWDLKHKRLRRGRIESLENQLALAIRTLKYCLGPTRDVKRPIIERALAELDKIAGEP